MGWVREEKNWAAQGSLAQEGSGGSAVGWHSIQLHEHHVAVELETSILHGEASLMQQNFQFDLEFQEGRRNSKVARNEMRALLAN